MILDGGEAFREMSAAVWLQRWLGDDTGILDQLNRLVLRIEEEFIEERGVYSFPDTYDQRLLDIYRNGRIAALMPHVNERYLPFLLARIKKPVELPSLPKTSTEDYLTGLEKRYGRVSV